MTQVSRLNSNTPFLKGVPNSEISREWWLVLNSIVTALGGGTTIQYNLDEVNALINELLAIPPYSPFIPTYIATETGELIITNSGLLFVTENPLWQP